jgi:hypothetical protein
MNIKNYKSFVNESNKFKITEQIDFLNRYIKGKWHLNDEGVVDVDGDFNCFNKGISDFIGIKFGKVNGDFDCSHNNLSSLEGAPKEVTGNFDCSYNNLTSLKGSPKEVGFGFYCQNNSLTSLDGVPKEVGGFFYFDHNEGISSETLKMISIQMRVTKSDYKTVLKSLWKEIPIEDKTLLYTPDLDWVDPEEASKLAKLKKYNGIKKMI